MNTYSHTQRGWLQSVVLISAGACAAGAWFNRAVPPVRLQLLVITGVFLLLSWAFAWLIVRDEGDRLAVRFGPLPLFRKLIPYAEMTGAEPCRTSFWAGWGIHRTRRGWLWNIHGRDAVEVVTRKGNTLIGTDDPQGLATFLKTKIPAGTR
jgi:hypothetical protein